jgi:hypothetical protein
MFRSQVENISGMRKITVLRANAPGDFIFALSAVEALRAVYASTEIILLAQKGGDISCVESILYENIHVSLTQREDRFFGVACYSGEKKM